MKFGLLFALRNLDPSGKPQSDVYRDMLEQVHIAEELGFDSVWMSEHHLVPDGYCPSPLVAAAAAAARTRTITIGTRVLLLPLYDPLHVAEDAAVVDLIANGRFVLGAGIGYKVDEFKAFGVDRRHRGSIMDEQVEVIKKAWTEEQFSFAGKHYQYDGVSVFPRPAQSPHPPIWLAARGGKAIDRAARLADGFHGSGEPAVFERFADAMRRYGRDPNSVPIAESRQCWVAPTREQAWQEAGPGVMHALARYATWFSEAADLPHDSERSADPGVARENEFIGTAEEVVDKYHQLVERAPQVTHSIMHVPPGIEHEAVVRHLELFSRKVIPAFE